MPGNGTKEIGIEKVLGASVGNLWRLLSTEFVMLGIIVLYYCNTISYYYLDDWLTNYDYRISISWKVFLFASLFRLFITLVTVSFQSIKSRIIKSH